MAEGNDIQRLTQRLDALVLVNERLIQALTQSTASPISLNKPINTVAASTPSTTSPALPPTVPTTTRARRNTPVSVLDFESIKKPSLFTGEESSESEDDESFFVQETLPPESFSEIDLKTHIRKHDWEAGGRALLEDIYEDEARLAEAQLVPRETDAIREHATYHHMNVYEVGSDGSALPYNAETKDLSQAIWQSLSNTNTDASRQRKAVGRIIIVREPSPLLFGAIHLTMNNHFHMDQVFRLLTDDTPSKAYMKGCLKNEPRQQRSFIWSFKYHCIVGDSCRPKAWQRSDKNLEFNKDHIPISECSSVVALSLSGKATNTLRRRSRKARTVVGYIYDPFAPWRVLSMQSFPDWESTVDVHEQNKHYVNGPEAFLTTVLAEYRDAAKRLRDINEAIVALVTPPAVFMFDGNLRDKLLFEDKRYTYSRRYFWAFQTLGQMNDNIEEMINTYKENFTEEVWTGEHHYIWPGTRDVSSRYSNWRKKMTSLRKQFDISIKDLGEILELNRKEQKDIKSLRDQLFSGTSVRESREAIKQQDNIKLLTLVTIFFLPLTFVTSVFGMTNMPPNDNFVRFGIATVTICLPSYLLIFSLSSDRWLERYDRWWTRLHAFLAMLFFQPQRQPSQKFWTGLFRIESQPPPTQDPQQRQVEANALRRASRAIQQDRQRPSFPRDMTLGSRESSVKFDIPTYAKRANRSRQDLGLEKSPSDQGPLSTLPEEQTGVAEVRRGLFKSFAERLSGQNSARSPV